jgi:hypothetical protein
LESAAEDKVLLFALIVCPHRLPSSFALIICYLFRTRSQRLLASRSLAVCWRQGVSPFAAVEESRYLESAAEDKVLLFALIVCPHCSPTAVQDKVSMFAGIKESCCLLLSRSPTVWNLPPRTRFYHLQSAAKEDFDFCCLPLRIRLWEMYWYWDQCFNKKSVYKIGLCLK